MIVDDDVQDAIVLIPLLDVKPYSTHCVHGNDLSDVRLVKKRVGTCVPGNGQTAITTQVDAVLIPNAE